MAKESRVGLIFYNIANGEYKILKRLKKVISDEKKLFKTSTPKEKFKDILFIVSMLGFWSFMIWVVVNVKDFSSPTITYNDGTHLAGNCEFIWEEWRFHQGIFNTSILELNNYSSTTTTLKPLIILTDTKCPEPKPCPKLDCPPIPVCKCEICTKCPSCSFELSPQDINWFLNECRIKTGGIAYQSGSADTCDYAATYFKVPNYPRYKTRPSSGVDIQTMFSSGLVSDKNPGQFTFNYYDRYGKQCFNISQYPDQNNRTRWSWKREECMGSTLTICHI